MIPVMLFGLDIITLALSSSVNQHLVKDAVRAASNQKGPEEARQAAQILVDRFKTNTIIPSVKLVEFKYDSCQKVYAKVQVTVKVPAPFPFFEKTDLNADATAAVVGDPQAFLD